jgi:hypothetical protein
MDSSGWCASCSDDRSQGRGERRCRGTRNPLRCPDRLDGRKRAHGAGTMKPDAASISLAGSPLGDIRHVCAFFGSDDEEYRVLLPFVKDGFDCGHKAIHVVNPAQRADHLHRLATAGIDTAAAAERGQFELRSNTETYIRDGRFDQDRMLAVFEQLASGNAKHRFPLSRIVCRMDWAAEGRAFVDNVIEFESRVNDVWRHHDDAVVCTYNLEQFRGDTVIDIMRTHPMVIVGGILQRNPFFMPPEQFLPEFRARRAKDPRGVAV